jgi:carboxymethylenebutenolidase
MDDMTPTRPDADLPADDLTTSQLGSLVARTEFSRRAFAMTSLGAGFALAAQPVSAQTVITTDAVGLTAGEVKVRVADGEIPAYRAYPAGKLHAPVVLVIHEIFGVHEHIKDLCRRLAKQGYYAIAADLFARYGDASKVADIQSLMGPGGIVSKATDDQVKGDLDAAVKFAASEKADTGKLGVTGFCWGGRQTWLYTAANPAVKTACPWYGPLVSGANGHTVISVAGEIKGRVLGFYGGLDLGIKPEMVEQMRAALAAAGDTRSKIIVYADAQHGFNADYRPSYQPADAKDAWGKMLGWFKAHGVA